MTTAQTSQDNNCPYCASVHKGKCPLVKAIEYHENGAVKRVEFHGSKTDLGDKSIFEHVFGR